MFNHADACDDFWDSNFENALSGDIDSGLRLLEAINRGSLIPPGRESNTYYPNSISRNNDLRYFYRFALRPYKREGTLLGGSYADPIQHWLNLGVRDFSWEIIEDLRPYLNRDCAERSGIPSDDIGWVNACIKILEADNILNTESEFLNSVPEGANACENKSNRE